MEMQEEEEVNMADWAELTHACLLNIFSRLTIEERWKITMFVCKSWFEASKDASLWSLVNIDVYFDATREIPSWWTLAFQDKIDAILRSIAEWSDGSLRELYIRHCSDRSLALVADRSPNLQTLSIRSSQNVTDVSLSKTALGCRMLRELDISYCYNISPESLRLIGHNCQNLTVLKRNLLNWLDPSQHTGIIPAEYLNAAPQCGDEEAAAIAESMPNLKHLELRFSKLSGKSLVLIVQGCPNLEYLDLFGCANLNSRVLEHAPSNLMNLKKLVRPNFYIPRSVFHTERYGHWRLYDERFQTNVFQI